MRESPASRASNRETAAAIQSPYRRAIQFGILAWILTVIAATVIGITPTLVTTISVVVGIVLAGLVYADINTLRSAGVEWDVDRFIYYPAVVMLPVVAAVYLWDRTNRIDTTERSHEQLLTDRLENEMREDGQTSGPPHNRD